MTAVRSERYRIYNIVLSKVSSQDTSVLENIRKCLVVTQEQELRSTGREMSVLAKSTVAQNRMAIDVKLVCEQLP